MLSSPEPDPLRARSRPSRRPLAASCLLALIVSGCAAFVPNQGIPARMVPAEYKGSSREIYRTLDLSLLRQSPPAEYRIDHGDVLGIYIDGVLGSKDEIPPVNFPVDHELAPGVGYPIPVREDGTITLPLATAIPVRGLSLRELEDRLRKVYTEQHPVLKPGHERILVSLQKPRSVRVLVMRQEAGNTTSRPLGHELNQINPEKRGVGQVIALPAYRNDVLNALAETGGLPGQDADNVVYVMRRSCQSNPELPQPLFNPQPATLPGGNAHTAADPNGPGAQAAGMSPDGASAVPGYWTGPWDNDPTVDSPYVVKIPLRLAPGETPQFCEGDIVLHDGDVVFLESREKEYFFTAGLLGGGQYSLPRDHDLDVLGAIAVAETNTRSTAFRPTKAIGGVSALNQDITVSASKVIVFRKLPNGQEIPIKIDLYRAMKDPAERILIQPGDRVVLQYSRPEAVAAFLERHLFEGFLIGAATTFLYNRN